MNDNDSSVNIQQMNHLCENNGSCFAVAWSMVEDSDKWGWEDTGTQRRDDARKNWPFPISQEWLLGKTECQMLFNSGMKQVQDDKCQFKQRQKQENNNQS